MKKIKIKLDDMEFRIIVKLLYETRNELLQEGRYTDAIDELLIKLPDSIDESKRDFHKNTGHTANTRHTPWIPIKPFSAPSSKALCHFRARDGIPPPPATQWCRDYVP